MLSCRFISRDWKLNVVICTGWKIYYVQVKSMRLHPSAGENPDDVDNSTRWQRTTRIIIQQFVLKGTYIPGFNFTAALSSLLQREVMLLCTGLWLAAAVSSHQDKFAAWFGLSVWIHFITNSPFILALCISTHLPQSPPLFRPSVPVFHHSLGRLLMHEGMSWQVSSTNTEWDSYWTACEKFLLLTTEKSWPLCSPRFSVPLNKEMSMKKCCEMNNVLMWHE